MYTWSTDWWFWRNELLVLLVCFRLTGVIRQLKEEGRYLW